MQNEEKEDKNKARPPQSKCYAVFDRCQTTSIQLLSGIRQMPDHSHKTNKLRTTMNLVMEFYRLLKDYLNIFMGRAV